MKKKKKVCELISQVTKKKHQLIIRKEKKLRLEKNLNLSLGCLMKRANSILWTEP